MMVASFLCLLLVAAAAGVSAEHSRNFMQYGQKDEQINFQVWPVDRVLASTPAVLEGVVLTPRAPGLAGNVSGERGLSPCDIDEASLAAAAEIGKATRSKVKPRGYGLYEAVTADQGLEATFLLIPVYNSAELSCMSDTLQLIDEWNLDHPDDGRNFIAVGLVIAADPGIVSDDPEDIDDKFCVPADPFKFYACNLEGGAANTFVPVAGVPLAPGIWDFTDGDSVFILEPGSYWRALYSQAHSPDGTGISVGWAFWILSLGALLIFNTVQAVRRLLAIVKIEGFRPWTTLPQATLTIELIACLIRYTLLCDPLNTIGIFASDYVVVATTAHLAVGLCASLLITFYWQEQLNKVTKGKTGIIGKIKVFRKPAICGLCCILTVETVLDIAWFVFLGSSIIFVLSTVIYLIMELTVAVFFIVTGIRILKALHMSRRINRISKLLMLAGSCMLCFCITTLLLSQFRSWRTIVADVTVWWLTFFFIFLTSTFQIHVFNVRAADNDVRDQSIMTGSAWRTAGGGSDSDSNSASSGAGGESSGEFFDDEEAGSSEYSHPDASQSSDTYDDGSSRASSSLLDDDSLTISSVH